MSKPRFDFGMFSSCLGLCVYQLQFNSSVASPFRPKSKSILRLRTERCIWIL